MATSSRPNLVLDRAIQRFDVLSYVRDRGATQAQHHEWVMDCPVCGKPKLVVNVNKKTFHCWVCQKYERIISSDGVKNVPVAGAGGLLNLLKWVEGYDTEKAFTTIVSGSTWTNFRLDELPNTELYSTLYNDFHMASAIEVPEGGSPINAVSTGGILPYLQQRGITLEDVRDFGLFWCTQGRYAYRLVFPVWEESSFVYFQARAVWDLKPGDIKCLNPVKRKGLAVSSDVLMNLDVARHYPRVVVTEGPIDCVHAGRDAVCSFGKALHGVQIAKLVRSGVKAIDLMWDADAVEDMQGFAPMLSALFDVRLVYLPKGDPGDYTRAELNLFRQRATSFHGASRLSQLI